MKRIVEAKVKWLPAKRGGRTSPPWGGRYSTVVRFEDEPSHDSGMMWSLVVDLGTVEEGSMEVVAPVWLLAYDKPGAPNHLLVRGGRFSLIEGCRVVAEGEIL